MYKIRNLIIILVMLLLIVKCKEQEKNAEGLKYKIDESFRQLNNINNNPAFQKSPMYLFALNSNIKANNIINELKQKGNDTIILLKKLRLFKKDLITHSYNDSLISKYENLLTSEDFKSTKKARLELENNVLKANYLFINDMLNSLKKLQNNQEKLPYIIPLNTEIYGTQAMEAFIILPEPQNSKLVFIYPDSIKYDCHRNYFIYLSGKPHGMKDSILINILIKKSEFKDERILLKTYYKINY
jgi:hypothetical protein